MSANNFEQNASQIEATVERLCDELDKAAQEQRPSHAHPLDRRYGFRQSNVIVSVAHPSGGIAKLRAFTRSLWCGGVCFLHTNFVYPGSACTITLTRKDGEHLVASGPLSECRLVHGSWHESSIRFSKRIDPLLFLIDEQTRPVAEDRVSDIAALAGRVLYVDDSTLDHRLMTHYLRASRITLVHAATPDEITKAITGNGYDILLCDLNLNGRDGLEVVRKARDAGFCGPIVVVTAEERGDHLARCKAAGVWHVLHKPYQQQKLVQLLARLHEQIGAVVSDEPLYSSIDEEPNTHELLAAYVEDARKLVARLLAAMTADDLAATREICQCFKGTAAGYGFIPLQVAAEAAVASLDATMSVGESRAPLRTLELLCGRLTLRSDPSGGQKGEAA